VVWSVLVQPEADTELSKIPSREKVTTDTALDKLRALGPQLDYPHSSAVRSSPGSLRELRPSQGRCPWRAFYRQIGLVQPQIARLEKAEHQPSFETLAKLSRATGLKFQFEVASGDIELTSA
jgi:hypothetical protein